MIAYDQLAAFPGAVAMAPAPVWIAAVSLAALAVVIVVRLYRDRKPPVKGGTDVREEEPLPGILCGVDRNREPEKSGEQRNPEKLARENRALGSREHLP